MKRELERWTPGQIEAVRILRLQGRTLADIAPLVGRSRPAVKAMVEREGIRATPAPKMTPAVFAARCREIRALVGHARHRAFDRACEDALRAAGYGEGVAIFEESVAPWHRDGDPYPYGRACPDCEKDA